MENSEQAGSLLMDPSGTKAKPMTEQRNTSPDVTLLSRGPPGPMYSAPVISEEGLLPSRHSSINPNNPPPPLGPGPREPPGAGVMGVLIQRHVPGGKRRRSQAGWGPKYIENLDEKRLYWHPVCAPQLKCLIHISYRKTWKISRHLYQKFCL